MVIEYLQINFCGDESKKKMPISIYGQNKYHQVQNWEILPQQRIIFIEFAKKYIKELKCNRASAAFLTEIKTHEVVTVLKSVKEIENSELAILKQFLEENI